MPFEPAGGERGDAFKGARLFEEVRRGWNNLERHLAVHAGHRVSIHGDDRNVIAADDQERRRDDLAQRGARQIGTAAARHHGENVVGPGRRCFERRSSTCAGAKHPNGKIP